MFGKPVGMGNVWTCDLIRSQLREGRKVMTERESVCEHGVVVSLTPTWASLTRLLL